MQPLSIGENWARIKTIPKNEFITLIGHDDILNENYLEVMNGLIERHPSASLYQAHYQYINSEGKIIRDCLPMDEVQKAHEFIALYMCGLIESTGTGYMMRSKDYDNCGGINPEFKNLIFADFALWINLISQSYKATSIETTFQYRIHNSVSKLTNGQEYQEAFFKFVDFIIKKENADGKIKMVTKRYGGRFLLYFCEALSHRILKTPKQNRQITVKDFIDKCKNYAGVLIPGQNFTPEKKFRISIAKKIDNNFLLRYLFKVWKSRNS